MKKLIPIFLVGTVVIGSTIAGPVRADDTAQLRQQVQELQNRVNQLESQQGTKPQAAMVPVYDQWEDPFTQMMLLRENLDRNLRQAFADTGAFNPRLDMTQNAKEYIITMDIPGMDKDKINVESKDDMLVISGERRSETENKGGANNQYYRQERSFGTFMQAIPLPDDARRDQINATYNNGVLKVTVPRIKKEDQRAQGGKIPVR